MLLYKIEGALESPCEDEHKHKHGA